MEKEKAIKISLTIVGMMLIIFVWVITLRYNLQGGFKNLESDHLSSQTASSTATGLEANIKTTRQQLTISWELFKNLFTDKTKKR